MKFSTTDLSNFIQASSCTTLMQAAKKLEISQPALSESIFRLENKIGYKLFYRSRTGIQLTPNGNVFIEKAKEVLFQIEELYNPKPSAQIFNKKVITLGIHATVAQYTLPRAFQILKKEAPDYNFNIIHGSSRDIQYSIQRGLIDVGIVVNSNPVPDLIIQNLAKDKVAVWHSAKTFSNDTLFYNSNLFQTHSILKRFKKIPEKVIHTDSLELIVQLTDQGLGLGIIPERVVKLLKPKLVSSDVFPSYLDQIDLVYRPEFGKDRAEKITIESLKTVFISK